MEKKLITEQVNRIKSLINIISEGKYDYDDYSPNYGSKQISFQTEPIYGTNKPRKEKQPTIKQNSPTKKEEYLFDIKKKEDRISIIKRIIRG